ncbi:MAG: DUF1559 domain-containing protein, partial [Planctomycetaceae bacterium]|nr:DUF1559 domain-containing protein [Planctomycetaceae bacterium]
MHNYHSTYNCFPVSIGWNARTGDRQGAFSDKVMLLPYLERDNEYKLINIGDFPYSPDWLGGNAAALSGTLPVFNCPSNPEKTKNGRTAHTYAISAGVIYGKSSSKGLAYGGTKPNGLASYQGSGWDIENNILVTIATVTDGTSNTAAYAEFLPRLASDIGNSGPRTTQMHGWVGDQNMDADQLRQACLSSTNVENDRAPVRGSGWSWSWIGTGNAYSHTMNPNEKPCLLFNDGGDWFGDTLLSASSAHTGGVQILLTDGSVRFVSDNVDHNTWKAIGTRDRREVIGEY